MAYRCLPGQRLNRATSGCSTTRQDLVEQMFDRGDQRHFYVMGEGKKLCWVRWCDVRWILQESGNPLHSGALVIMISQQTSIIYRDKMMSDSF